jgi:predicted ATPase
MIELIEALRYRSLMYVSQPLLPFQVLVGPNASGKSTFLDVIAFMADAVGGRSGVAGAVAERAPEVTDLCWMGDPPIFELAIEARIPDRLRSGESDSASRVRYEIQVGPDAESGEASFLAENLWLLADHTDRDEPEPWQPTLFPIPPEPPETIVVPPGHKVPPGWRPVLKKVPESGNDYFRSEVSDWNNLFRLGPHRSALASIPEDEERFPVSIWFRSLLLEGVQRMALDGRALRQPSPPGAPERFLPDGSNLPWVVERLRQASPDRYRQWLAHVRTALPDVRGIRSAERAQDRYRYLVLELASGLETPSWSASDGALRILALTVLAHLPDLNGVVLIEAPENRIHPKTIETVFQSLSSVRDAQVLIATHSPVMLSLADPDQVLCFGRDESGATAIVSGSQHPNVAERSGEVDLGALFAAGLLG